MNKIKSILAVLLCTVLLLSGCSTGKDGYATTVAATYGDRTIYLDEANFWLRAAELNYSIYEQAYGASFWSQPSGRRGQTVADTLREDVMAEFRQINILLDHASEYDTELSEAELTKIDETIVQMKSVYGDYLFTESIIGPYSDESLKESLIQRSKALKVWQGVREQATTSVNEEECKSFTLRYFSLGNSTSIKDGEESVSGVDAAVLLAEALKAGTSFDELTETYSSVFYATKSFRRNDTKDDSEMFKVGSTMQEGEIQQFTDTSDNGPVYYIVLCLSDDDAEAAATARESLESVQKEEYFNQVFVEWQKDAKDFSVKNAFFSLPLPKSN